LFRAIDVCLDTLAILAAALPGVKFRPDRIELDPAIHAAEAASELVVKEGISFRDAYRRIAEKLKK
jgi:argininosuccinate lyase